LTVWTKNNIKNYSLLELVGAYQEALETKFGTHSFREIEAELNRRLKEHAEAEEKEIR